MIDDTTARRGEEIAGSRRRRQAGVGGFVAVLVAGIAVVALTLAGPGVAQDRSQTVKTLRGDVGLEEPAPPPQHAEAADDGPQPLEVAAVVGGAEVDVFPGGRRVRLVAHAVEREAGHPPPVVAERGDAFHHAGVAAFVGEKCDLGGVWHGPRNYPIRRPDASRNPAAGKSRVLRSNLHFPRVLPSL